MLLTVDGFTTVTVLSCRLGKHSAEFGGKLLSTACLIFVAHAWQLISGTLKTSTPRWPSVPASTTQQCIYVQHQNANRWAHTATGLANASCSGAVLYFFVFFVYIIIHANIHRGSF